LVTPVLLRPARPDALQLDPQFQPPHAQSRQPGRTGAGKGRPVVAADRIGQAVALEGQLEAVSSAVVSGSVMPLAAQDHTRAGIGYGKWVAPFAVAKTKLALGVHAPHAARSTRDRAAAAVTMTAAAAAPGLDQARPFQDVVHRAHGGKLDARIAAL